MKKLIITLFLLFFSFSTETFASTINQLVFFGDSLSDDGNLYRLLKIVPKSPPYYEGRFSNGPTWAEHVGKYFYDHFYSAYVNYAYGGATAILHKPRQDNFIAPMLLEEEVELYLTQSMRSDKKYTLYVIWIGANDYLYDRQPSLEDLTTSVVNKIGWSIDKLINKGGKNFLILNLPDLSKTPYAREEKKEARLQDLSHMHNHKLDLLVQKFKNKNPSFQFVAMDIDALFVDLLQHPEKYNQKYHTHINDTYTSCWKGNWSPFLKLEENDPNIIELLRESPSLKIAYDMGNSALNQSELCTNPDDHIFWDALHPTAVIHSTLAEVIITLLKEQGMIPK